MPQLPSGTHVGLSVQRVRELIEEGDFLAHMAMRLDVREPADLLPMIDLVLFKPWADGGVGREGLDALGEPYLAPFMLKDLGTPQCPWPAQDQEFLRSWMTTPRALAWQQETLDELQALCARVNLKLPEALKGILD